jgi:hypothetical protein
MREAEQSSQKAVTHNENVAQSHAGAAWQSASVSIAPHSIGVHPNAALAAAHPRTPCLDRSLNRPNPKGTKPEQSPKKAKPGDRLIPKREPRTS